MSKEEKPNLSDEIIFSTVDGFKKALRLEGGEILSEPRIIPDEDLINFVDSLDPGSETLLKLRVQYVDSTKVRVSQVRGDKDNE